MKFSIEDFFSKCEHILRKLRIWSYLLKKSSMENFIFLRSVISLNARLLLVNIQMWFILIGPRDDHYLSLRLCRHIWSHHGKLSLL